MRAASLTIASLALAMPAAAAGESVETTDGAVRMRLNPAMIAMACTVTRSSGDAATDEAACLRALAGRVVPEGLPAMTIVETDATGRMVGCRPPPEVRPAPDFAVRCAAHLARMAQARSMVALGSGSWLRPRDFRPAPARSGRLVARLGVGGDGVPFYCLTVESSGSRRFDDRACRLLLRRARFRPALDEQGRPMPSTFTYPVRWQR